MLKTRQVNLNAVPEICWLDRFQTHEDGIHQQSSPWSWCCAKQSTAEEGSDTLRNDDFKLRLVEGNAEIACLIYLNWRLILGNYRNYDQRRFNF